MKTLALSAIRLYQTAVAPSMPPACRFEPTCSRYGYESIDRYGLFRGGWMTLRRVVRCRPFRAGGYDPVP